MWTLSQSWSDYADAKYAYTPKCPYFAEKADSSQENSRTRNDKSSGPRKCASLCVYIIGSNTRMCISPAAVDELVVTSCTRSQTTDR